MTEVIAHRGVWWPGGPAENSAGAISAALGAGFSIETDVRCCRDGRLVLSHDPDLMRVHGLRGHIGEREASEMPMLCGLSAALALPGADAVRWYLHLKESAVLPALAEMLGASPHVDATIFMDLEESLPFVDRCLRDFPGLSTAVHLSGPPVGSLPPVGCFWLDEPSRGWISEETVRPMRSIGARVCAVSPEICPGGVADEVVKETWRRWCGAGVGGICTDAPRALCENLDAAVARGCR